MLVRGNADEICCCMIMIDTHDLVSRKIKQLLHNEGVWDSAKKQFGNLMV